MGVTHAFTSAKSDGSDATKVQPSNWNAAHTVTGMPIKRYSATYSTNADLSTVIPLDDTVPTSSEGTEVLSVSVVVDNSTQVVRARFNGLASAGSGNIPIAAIFRGTTCVCTGCNYTAFGTNYYGNLALEVEEVPGAAGTYTYSVRVGGSAGSVRLNGSTSCRLFGGTAKSVLVVEVIEP